MSIEQLGPSAPAALIAVKPQESAPTRVPEKGTENSKPRADLASASADVQTVQKAVQEANPSAASTLQFHTDAETGKIVVKITNSETGELVRQIPMEDMLALAKSLDRLQGLLLQTKA